MGPTVRRVIAPSLDALLRPLQKWNRPKLPTAPLSSDDPRLRTAVAHLAALAGALLLMAVDRPPELNGAGTLTVLGIVVGLSVLRTVNVRRRLALSTLALDAVATVVLLASTGAAGSPLYVLALAGVWWAANIPRPRSGLAYAVAFAVAYALLVVPEAMREHALAGAAQNVVALIVVAFLSDRFVRVDRRALELNEALEAPHFALEQVALRDGLLLALRSMDIPMDVVVAAGRIGLTAIQAELLSYLVMGLSNQEIADASGVSESAVRCRLTRLYRAFGVRGRLEAAQFARELRLSEPAQKRRSHAS
ncbi:MAG: helix-turn-helix transcriptional regulator [Chloroflexota bacterium]|nr:helix-turn-helix transcriptional regulator [Chloroflexota bacterium]